MDEEILDPTLDPGLLQAVLADPVLLQAVDPRVLQAVLVTAAAANLVNTEGETQLGEEAELGEFGEAEDFSLLPSQQSSPTNSQSPALRHKLGGAFNLPSPPQSGLGQTGQTVNINNRFGAQSGQAGKLGSAFSNLDSPSLEFPQQGTLNLFSGRTNLPQAPQFSSPDRKTFGTAFNVQQSQTNIIGPQQSQPRLPATNTDVELISQECHHL